MSTLVGYIGIKPREICALVGAGNMTSTVLRLAEEMRAEGRRVVSTSTVAMQQVNPALPLSFLVEPKLDAVLGQLPALLDKYGHVRLATSAERDDKIKGVPPEWVPRIASLPFVGNVIVGADGSRHRPLKAPNEKEPSIPPGTDVLLVLAGLGALGKPLDDETVHRPELAAPLMEIDVGDPITAEAVARLLASPQGGLKAAPPEARVWFVLTGWNDRNTGEAERVALGALSRAERPVEGALLLESGHNGSLRVITR